MTVFERPPSDSCSRRVSFESRYGMRTESRLVLLVMQSRSVEITRPSVSSDWLMLRRSASRDLCARSVLPAVGSRPAVRAHSEPARSTRCSLPLHSIEPPSEVTRVEATVSVKTQCERLEVLFMRVSPTCRRCCASRIRCSTSFAVSTLCDDRLCTCTRPRSPSFLGGSSAIMSLAPYACAGSAAPLLAPEEFGRGVATGFGSSSTSRSVSSSL